MQPALQVISATHEALGRGQASVLSMVCGVQTLIQLSVSTGRSWVAQMMCQTSLVLSKILFPANL